MAERAAKAPLTEINTIFERKICGKFNGRIVLDFGRVMHWFAPTIGQFTASKAAIPVNAELRYVN